MRIESPENLMDCTDQPFAVLSRMAPCLEIPPCQTVYCFDDVRCLLARSTAPVVAGCRSSLGKDLFCACLENLDPAISLLWRLRTMSNGTALESLSNNAGPSSLNGEEDFLTTTMATVITTTVRSSKLSGGAIAGIVIGVLLFVVLSALAAFFIIRYVKDRRKNHGEYRPQWEEEHHAKDLPHIQPPAIEGLI